MTDRLIVVSNRIPSETPSGGLVVALHEALSETGGIWIGAGDEFEPDPQPVLKELQSSPYSKRAFALSEEERASYYLGYSNSVLWPLCHRRTDLISLKAEYADGYQRVNRRVAKAIAAIAKKDDIIWVQDYHFLPLARYLRDEGVTSRVGLFLHIPFPVASDLLALPERRVFPDWISQFDLIGLQTKADVARCLELFRGLDGAEQVREGRVTYKDRAFAVHSFPIGIDANDFRRAAETGDGRESLGLRPGEPLVIGVDRLDYSKGLPNRFRAFGAYLEMRDGGPRPTLLQIAPPSREEVTAYRDVQEELEGIAGRINGHYAELDWTPIRYINRAVPREVLAPLYRAARVGLVTPMVDGMNLVAKEYVAAQDAEDPGVLILSNTAGAAEQLTDAILVNPFDVAEIADAIDTALEMPLDERQERWRAQFETIQRFGIDWWRRTYLEALREAGAPRAGGDSSARRPEVSDA